MSQRRLKINSTEDSVAIFPRSLTNGTVEVDMSANEISLVLDSGSSDFTVHFIGVKFTSNNAFDGVVSVSIKIGSDQLIIDSRAVEGSGPQDYFYHLDTPLLLKGADDLLVETTNMEGNSVSAVLFYSLSATG